MIACKHIECRKCSFFFNDDHDEALSSRSIAEERGGRQGCFERDLRYRNQDKSIVCRADEGLSDAKLLMLSSNIFPSCCFSLLNFVCREDSQRVTGAISNILQVLV